MMRENESDREGQPGEYVNPWVPNAGGGGTDDFGDDALVPFYADSYTAPVDSYQAEPGRYRADNPHGSAAGDTIAFGSETPDWGNWTPDGNFWPPPPPPTRIRGGRLLVYVGVAVVAAAIGAAATVAVNANSTTSSAGTSSHENIPAQHNNAAGSGANARLNAAFVERRVEPGLVDIVSTLSYNSETAEGTGMILSSDGLVLTNNHVIDQSTSIKAVRVDGGRAYQARVLGYDSTDDVALLQLEGA